MPGTKNILYGWSSAICHTPDWSVQKCDKSEVLLLIGIIVSSLAEKIDSWRVGLPSVCNSVVIRAGTEGCQHENCDLSMKILDICADMCRFTQRRVQCCLWRAGRSRHTVSPAQPGKQSGGMRMSELLICREQLTANWKIWQCPSFWKISPGSFRYPSTQPLIYDWAHRNMRNSIQ